MADGYISQIKTPDNKTYLLKDSEKTDEKVKQTGITTNNDYPILFKNSANTTNETSGINYSNGNNATATANLAFTFNPSTGNLTIPELTIAKKDDNYGLFPNANNYNQIGKSGLAWYRAYVTNYYGTNSFVTNWSSNNNIGTAATSSTAATKGKVNFYNTCAANGTQTKTTLEANNGTSNITVTLPNATGTLALTTDPPAEHTHSHLVAKTTINSGDNNNNTFKGAIQKYFTDNKTTVPRNSLVNFYSSAYSNGSLVFGYYLSSYDTNPYGGFYVAHYDTPRYVGIMGGSYTESKLARIDIANTITSGQIMIADGSDGKIKTSGYTIATSVPANAVFTDHYAWGDITSKPDTATRWPKWNEISQSGAENINEGSSDITDNTEILTSYASNNGFADTNAKGVVYRRDAIHIYNYVNGKLGTMAHETASNYAKLASPAFTGTPTAPTAANGTNTTQIATTAFVNNTLSYVNAMRFKGTLGTGGTVTALPASHEAGDTYRVITAGTWAGKYCEIGTLIICTTDGTAANDAHWTSVETNEDGAVIGPSSSTDNAIARFDGTTGRIIQKSGVSINDDNIITSSGKDFNISSYKESEGEHGIFFRSGFFNDSTNKYNLSILTYDHSSNNVTPDGLSINANDGISFCTGANTRNERMRITYGGYVGIGTTAPSTKLHLHNGDLTISKEDTTANNAPAKINFSVKDTTKNITSSAYIAVYNDHSTTYNTNMVINSTGNTYVGAGESASTIYSAKGSTFSGENLFLSADSNVYVYAYADAAANRIGLAIDTNGNIIPQKAEAANNNKQNLGASDNRWATIYSTKFNGVLTPSSWIDGQRYQNGALNIADYSNTGNYNPWIRATNTWASGAESAKVGRWFSFGTLGTSFYLMGSVSTRTENSYDNALRYDTANGCLYAAAFKGNADTATSAGKWTTARTLTIGNKSQSVDGSGDVSWSLADIGAAPAVTGGYLPLSGGTLTGALTTANNTWNTIGDDAYLGDINKAGHIGIQGKNGNTGIFFTTYNQTTKTTGGAITWDGTKFSITSTTAVDASISGNAATATTATTATSANALNFVHTNELLLGNANSQSGIHINHRRVSGGATSGNTAITDYYFKNGNGATTGVKIHAETFNGNATSATGVKDASNANRIITIRYSGDGAAATDWIPMHDSSGNLVPVSSTNLANKVRDKASGSWNISSTKSTRLTTNTSFDYAEEGLTWFNLNGTAGAAVQVNDTPTSAWWHILRFNHSNTNAYYTDLAIPFNNKSIYYKRITDGTVPDGKWVKVLDEDNTTAPTTVPTLSWGVESTVFTLNGTAVKIKAMAKPTYTYSDVGAAPSSTVSCTTANVKSALSTGSDTAKFLNNKGEWAVPAYTTSLAWSAITSKPNLSIGNARIFYGTSSTAAGTAAKVVTCSIYDAYTAGDILVVKFDNANTAGSPTLNVNSKGAKNIRKIYNGAVNTLNANGEITGTCMFVYDGTQWLLTNADYNNTYTIPTSFSITANATDGLWDLTGTNGTNAVTYALAPYSSKGTTATFYTAATNPTLTTRLNYDGYLYATKLYSGGTEVSVSGHTHSYLSSISWSGDANLKLKQSVNGAAATDVLQFAAGSNITLTGASGKLTIAGTPDTKNTAGSTNSDSKLYLIGATSQAANPQTYSDAHVFETNGAFSAKTLGINADTDNDKVTLQWNATDSSLDFVFA